MTIDLDPRIRTIHDCDAAAHIRYSRLLVTHRVDYLPMSHPDVQALNAWYVDATNQVALMGGRTGYEDAGVTIPSTAKVDEAGARICRVDGCGRVLVKKPGRGRWPSECRVGEGCKVDGATIKPEPEPIRPDEALAARCGLCGCGKLMACGCGKNCGHPTHAHPRRAL